MVALVAGESLFRTAFKGVHKGLGDGVRTFAIFLVFFRICEIQIQSDKRSKNSENIVSKVSDLQVA